MVHCRSSGAGCDRRPVIMGKFRSASARFGFAVEHRGTAFFTALQTGGDNSSEFGPACRSGADSMILGDDSRLNLKTQRKWSTSNLVTTLGLAPPVNTRRAVGGAELSRRLRGRLKREERRLMIRTRFSLASLLEQVHAATTFRTIGTSVGCSSWQSECVISAITCASRSPATRLLRFN
jgi:hypothetical protein